MMNLKRMVVLGMVITGVISMEGCGNNVSANQEVADEEVITFTDKKEDSEIGTQIANPFHDVDTLEEASKIAGFDMRVPESVEGYEGTLIQAVENDLIQVIYGDLDHNVYVRKSSYDGDVSGDYNEYPTVAVKEINGHNVTIKSDGDLTYVVIWTDGSFNYSIQSNNGYDFSVAEELLEVVK